MYYKYNINMEFIYIPPEILNDILSYIFYPNINGKGIFKKFNKNEVVEHNKNFLNMLLVCNDFYQFLHENVCKLIYFISDIHLDVIERLHPSHIYAPWTKYTIDIDRINKMNLQYICLALDTFVQYKYNIEYIEEKSGDRVYFNGLDVTAKKINPILNIEFYDNYNYHREILKQARASSYNICYSVNREIQTRSKIFDRNEHNSQCTAFRCVEDVGLMQYIIKHSKNDNYVLVNNRELCCEHGNVLDHIQKIWNMTYQESRFNRELIPREDTVYIKEIISVSEILEVGYPYENNINVEIDGFYKTIYKISNYGEILEGIYCKEIDNIAKICIRSNGKLIFEINEISPTTVTHINKIHKFDVIFFGNYGIPLITMLFCEIFVELYTKEPLVDTDIGIVYTSLTRDFRENLAYSKNMYYSFDGKHICHIHEGLLSLIE